MSAPQQATAAQGAAVIIVTAGSFSNFTGFSVGLTGTRAPTTYRGNTINAIGDNVMVPSFFIVLATPNLGAAYFTSLRIVELGVVLLVSSATYSTNGTSTSTWQWGATVGLVNGSTYTVELS